MIVNDLFSWFGHRLFEKLSNGNPTGKAGTPPVSSVDDGRISSRKKKTLDTAQNETLPSQSIFRTKNR